MTPQRALIEAAEESLDRFPYSCQKGQLAHCRCGDCVEVRLRAAIASAKGAEEGVETKYQLEWYSNERKTWIPDMYIDREKELIDQRMDECAPGTDKLRMIQKDTYTTVISVREKEGL